MKKEENKKEENLNIITEDFTNVKYNTFEIFLQNEKEKLKDVKKIITKKVQKQKNKTNNSNEFLSKIEIFENSDTSGLIGQDHAVKLVADAFKRSFLNIDLRKTKPLGSFVFCGPTGVGKTELVKRLTLSLFGNLENLTRFDMSEYMESHSISKLIGTPPGYVGYDSLPALAVVNKRPNNIILFDEVEKAHPKIMDIFLQILDEGFIKDSKGNLILFNKTIIILTSNLGSRDIFNFFENKKDKNITDKEFIVLSEKIKNILMKKLRPELVNRFDDIIVFKPLNEDSSRQILENLLSEKKRNIRQEKKISLFIEEPVISYLQEKGYSIVFGARELIRTIQHYLENPLVNFLIAKKIKAPAKLNVFYNENKKALDFAII